MFHYYTDNVSKLSFILRRLATEFLPACIAQLVRVELLRRRPYLIEIPGASLSENSILKHYRYILAVRFVLFIRLGFYKKRLSLIE